MSLHVPLHILFTTTATNSNETLIYIIFLCSHLLKLPCHHNMKFKDGITNEMSFVVIF